MQSTSRLLLLAAIIVALVTAATCSIRGSAPAVKSHVQEASSITEAL